MEVIEYIQDDVIEFLHFLYDGLEGWAYSPTKDLQFKPNEIGHWNQYFFKWPEEEEQLIHHIKIQSKDLDTYISPALFSQANSSKEFIKASNVVWVEIDEKLPEGDYRPNYIVQTSSETHQHWYWRLDDPLDTVNSIEYLTRSITYTLEGADSSGWDANQVLRIPNTYNYKRNIAVVKLLGSTSNDSKLFLDSLPKIEKSKPLDLSNIPDITRVITKYSFSEEAHKLYFTLKPPENERSTYLVRLAYYCAEMGMNDSEIFSVLYNADERWTKFKDRTDRKLRLTEIINRIRFKRPKKRSSSLTLIGTHSFIKSTRTISWVIPGLLESKGNFLLTGPSDVGKTQFSLNMAIALALGQSILNFSIAQPSKILFASLEMGWEALKLFVDSMTNTLPVEQLNILEENLILVPLGESLYLNTKEGQEKLTSHLEGYNGLIIDSLGTSISGDISSHEVMQPYYEWSDKIRNKFDLWIWAIHHHRKANGPNKKPNTLDDVYGDRYITANASTVYCLWPTKQSSIIEAVPLKVRLAKKEYPWYMKRNDNLTFEKIDTKILNNPLLINSRSTAEKNEVPPQGNIKGM